MNITYLLGLFFAVTLLSGSIPLGTFFASENEYQDNSSTIALPPVYADSADTASQILERNKQHDQDSPVLDSVYYVEIGNKMFDVFYSGDVAEIVNVTSSPHAILDVTFDIIKKNMD